MEAYETMLKFLDAAIFAHKTAALEAVGLKNKLFYQKHVADFKQARRVLRLNYYTFEDYLKDGKVEPCKMTVTD